MHAFITLALPSHQISSLFTTSHAFTLCLDASSTKPPKKLSKRKKKAYAKVAKPYPNNRSKALQNSSGHPSTKLKQSHPCTKSPLDSISDGTHPAGPTSASGVPRPRHHPQGPLINTAHHSPSPSTLSC